MSQRVNPYGEGSRKEQVRVMFDRIAFRYDFLNRLLSFGVDTSWRRKVTRMVERQAPGRLLDLAAGTGDLTVAIARRCPGTKITGADLSPRMLDIARRKASRLELANLERFIEADAEALPFGGETFDAVTVAFGVRNFENPGAGMAEIFRVLSGGGKAYVLEFAMPDNKVFGGVYLLYFRKILPFIGGVLSGEKRAYRYLQRSVEAFPYGDAFAGIMTKAGFEDITQKKLTGGLAIIYCGTKKNNIS